MSAFKYDEYREAAEFAPGEVEQIAHNLARNCGYHVFPCRADNKRPVCPHGFKQASNDPAEIARLWRRYPGGLIGIATGAVSGIDVLDIDMHDLAVAWFSAAAPRLPSTRAYRTRSGGRHLYFRHAEGVVNTASKLAKGVDTRGDGGYAVFWYGAGFPCEDPSPPTDWPGWLLECVVWKPEPLPTPAQHRRSDHADKAIEGVLRLVSAASEGGRNHVLFWGACRLGERVQAGAIARTEAAALLAAAARATGLPELEARRTVASAWRAA